MLLANANKHVLRSRCTKDWQQTAEITVAATTCCSTAVPYECCNPCRESTVQCGILVIAEDGYAQTPKIPV